MIQMNVQEYCYTEFDINLVSFLGSGGEGDTLLGIDEHGDQYVVKLFHHSRYAQKLVPFLDVKEEYLQKVLLVQILSLEMKYTKETVKYGGIAILEYIEGLTLDKCYKYLAEYGNVNHAKMILAFNLMTAYIMLNSNSIYLRDLKASNLIVKKNLDVKFIDHGYICLMNKYDETYCAGPVGTFYLRPHLPSRIMEDHYYDEGFNTATPLCNARLQYLPHNERNKEVEKIFHDIDYWSIIVCLLTIDILSADTISAYHVLKTRGLINKNIVEYSHDCHDMSKSLSYDPQDTILSDNNLIFHKLYVMYFNGKRLDQLQTELASMLK